MNSRSLRASSRDLICRPVVPASPSMKIFVGISTSPTSFVVAETKKALRGTKRLFL
jgi:hypothetical protein